MERLCRRHAESRQRGGHPERDCGVLWRLAHPHQLRHLARTEPRVEGVGPAFHDVAARCGDTRVAHGRHRLGEASGQGAHCRDHAIARYSLRRTLDRLLQERIDREAMCRGVRRDAPDGPLHLR